MAENAASYREEHKMDKNLFFRNLDVPDHPVDVVLDTDAYNEVDDQFALAYLLNSKEKLHLKAVYAAPFYNAKSASPSDGMYKSYDEIMKILALTGNKEYEPFVYKGAEHYMKDEKTPAESDVVRDLISRAGQYSPKNPLRYRHRRDNQYCISDSRTAGNCGKYCNCMVRRARYT